MKKILVAIDDTPVSMKAVEYAGQFGGAADVQISLVHVLPNLPALLWDDGHILSETEKAEQRKVIDKWLAGRKMKMEPVFKKAVDLLTRMGVKADQIQVKSISDSTDIAESLLEEARNGGYQTLIVGRCDHRAKHILGSVSGKIVAQGRGMTVTVVE